MGCEIQLCINNKERNKTMSKHIDINNLSETYIKPKYICKEFYNGHICGDTDKITDSPESEAL